MLASVVDAGVDLIANRSRSRQLLLNVEFFSEDCDRD